LAAAAEAAAGGHDVVLYEATQRLGGQVALASAAPGHQELAETMLSNYRHLLGRANVRIELGVRAELAVIRDAGAECVVVATGARPYAGRAELAGVPVLSAWDVLAGARRPGRVVIADWGGDSVALDCAEVLAGEGAEVTLATGALVAGEGLHQYVRSSYLGRLHRAGVRFENHQALAGASGGRVHFGNVFAPELSKSIEAEVLILSLGRVPADSLPGSLTGAGIAHRKAGDCCSPRGIEEAVLEGTLAMRELLELPAGAAPSRPLGLTPGPSPRSAPAPGCR